MAPCEMPPGRGQVGTTPDGRITTDRMRSDYGYSKYDCETDRQMLSHLNNGQDYLDLMEIANANNVSFYPVDARGLAAFDRDLNENPVLGPADEIRLVRSRVESLRTLADNTDGLAVVDTNDLDKGFQRIVDDMTSYYLLGYYSTNTKLDGKVRKIKVRVKRNGVDVRARRSYRAATEEEIEQGTAQMTAAAAAAPASAVQVALNSIGSSRAGVPLRTAVSYAMVGGRRSSRACLGTGRARPGVAARRRVGERRGSGRAAAVGRRHEDRSAYRHARWRPALAERRPRRGDVARRRTGRSDANQADRRRAAGQRHDPVDDLAEWRRTGRACPVAPGPHHRRAVRAHGRQAVPPDRSCAARVAVGRRRGSHLGGDSRPRGQAR